MISCKRAAELTSRELDRPLHPVRRMALGFHLLLCSACQRFRTQIAEVDRAAGEFAHAADHPPDGGLSDDARARIRRVLAADTVEG